MDEPTIKEARRLLVALIETGEMLLKGGRTIRPKDDVFVGIVEKIAGRKIEEPLVTPDVTDFTPAGTHHTKPKPLEMGPPEEPPDV